MLEKLETWRYLKCIIETGPRCSMRTGKSGRAIIEAILDGERDGQNWPNWPITGLKRIKQP